LSLQAVLAPASSVALVISLEAEETNSPPDALPPLLLSLEPLPLLLSDSLAALIELESLLELPKLKLSLLSLEPLPLLLPDSLPKLELLEQHCFGQLEQLKFEHGSSLCVCVLDRSIIPIGVPPSPTRLKANIQA